MSARKARKPRPIYAWTWAFPDGALCYLAMPTRALLLADGYPSPDHKPIRVQLVPVKKQDWRRQK